MRVSRGPRRSTSVNAVALPKVRAARPAATDYQRGDFASGV